MICEDRRFDFLDVFLGGYYTAVDAGPSNIRNAADELFGALKRRNEHGLERALDRENLIFVCHSTGGIIVRYMLNSEWVTFSSKRVGLVLIASPSLGSSWANKVGLASYLYRHHIGLQLRYNSFSLRDLDVQFKKLIDDKKMPGLFGVEAYENHFIFRLKWLPPMPVVVPEGSAGRYFGAPILLRNTDHSSSVKPDNKRHPAYELLVDFVQKHFTNDQSIKLFPLTAALRLDSFNSLCLSIKPLMDENYRIFEDFGPNSGASSEAKTVRQDLSLWYAKRGRIKENNELIREKIKTGRNLVPSEFAEHFDAWISHIDAFDAHLADDDLDYREHQFPTSVVRIVNEEAAR